MALTGDRSLFAFDSVSVGTVLQGGDFLQACSAAAAANRRHAPPPHTAAMAKRKREVKSVNLQYITLVRWDDGPNESLTKRLMFQALFFFHHFLDLGHSKRIFAKNFARNHEKRIILGMSDTWATIRLSHRSTNPA